MKDSEMRELLHRAGDEVPEPDVAEITWSRGRVARRRRWTVRVIGVLAAVTVVGGLGLHGAGWSDGGLPQVPEMAGGTGDGASQRLEPPTSALEVWQIPSPDPEPAQLETAGKRTQLSEDEAQEAREAAQDAAHSADAAARMSGSTSMLAAPTLLHQGQQVWADVYTGCLGSRGYAVVRDGNALSVTLPDGKQDGDYRRDTQACRAELAMDAPTSVSPRADIDRAARVALTGRYFEYYWAQGCLVDAGLPTSPTMLAEEFFAGLALAQLPPWHPYQEAAREGRYAEAREACPIQSQS